MIQLQEDLKTFSFDIKAKLYELQIELSEGDITHKGYEKKKAKLLETFNAFIKKHGYKKDLGNFCGFSNNLIDAPNLKKASNPEDYCLAEIEALITHLESLNFQGVNGGGEGNCRRSSSSSIEEIKDENGQHIAPNGILCKDALKIENQETSSPRSKALRRKVKKLTRNESRYTSNIRQEAVQAALVKSKMLAPNVPIPLKRKSHLSTLYDLPANNTGIDTPQINPYDANIKNIDSTSSDSEIEDETSSVSTPQTSQSGGDGSGTFDKTKEKYYKYMNQDTRKKQTTPDLITSNIAQPQPSSIFAKYVVRESMSPLPLLPHQSNGDEGISSNNLSNKVVNGEKDSNNNQNNVVPNFYFEGDEPTRQTNLNLSKYKSSKAYLELSNTPPKNYEMKLTVNMPADLNGGDCGSSSPDKKISLPMRNGIQKASNVSCSSNGKSPFFNSSFYNNPAHASSFRDKSSPRKTRESGSPDNLSSGRISLKIQQLLNTLKRPKIKPLHDYFKDEDPELENFSYVDPNAPKPQGMTITPIIGEPLRVQTGRPRSLETALQRYGNSTPKSPAIMVLDTHGKPYLSLTYGKFLSRAYKISYSLLNKWRAKGHVGLKPGDRVALIYPNNDPLSFACAFYGCLLSGIIPVPLDVPLSRKDASYRQIGFLLGTCNVSLALTSDTCLKALPKIFGRSSQPNANSPHIVSSQTHASTFSASSTLPNATIHASPNPPSTGQNATGTARIIDDSNPRNGVHVLGCPGWPSLTWYSTENVALKPPKEWKPPPPVISAVLPSMSQVTFSDQNTITPISPVLSSCNDKLSTAYIEYTTSIDGTVKGVMVYKSSMLNHCKALTMACNYGEGEIMICVLDFKREVGLWHSVLTSVYNGMHVIFVPYSLMKINPSIWMHMVTKYKASIAIVKSRDLHWGLLAQKDHKDINLSSLNLLLVADGANPWSLSSCDAFIQTFESKGLRPEVLCTCAYSPEALTVSLKRPHIQTGRPIINQIFNDFETNKLLYGRSVLSMAALSYGLIRIDNESSLTSLTLQNVGGTMPGSIMVVIEIEGEPTLCKTDQIGEICVASNATANGYWSLKGLTNTVFKTQPIDENGHPISDKIFVRTGLFGFVSQNGLVYVCSSREGLMTVSGRRHNVDDLIATVLAVQPMKFIYRGRLAIFAIKVLKDERIVIVAEQRPDCSEEDSFLWMSRVLQAIDSIHQVGVYCLVLLPPNQLPKTPLGGIHVSETKRRFEEGSLHPANLLMCPHACVTNLPKPRQRPPEVSPASQYVGNMVKGERFALAHGLSNMNLLEKEENSMHQKFISETLKWRASNTPDHTIFTLLSSKAALTNTMTCQQLHKRAEKIAFLLGEKLKLQPEDHVALLYPAGTDLIASMFGCMYINLIPIPIRPPGSLNLYTTISTVRLIIEVSKAKIILTTSYLNKLLKSKEASSIVDSNSWPLTIETDDLPKKKPNWTSEEFVNSFLKDQIKEKNLSVEVGSYHDYLKEESTAYLDFSVSTTGTLVGVKISHIALTSLCRSEKMACELYPSRLVAVCLDPYSGLGLNLWCFNSVYSGHHSLLIPPAELENHPFLWLTAINQYKIRDTYCSYAILELCTKLITSDNIPKLKNMDMSCLRNCIVVAEERPRIELTQAFSKLYAPFGLSPHCLSTSFGCRVNIALCLQGASNPSPSIVYADVRSLRNDRVILVEKGSPFSVSLMESGKLLPGISVVIANPETSCLCADSHLGEIWVNSRHNSSGYYAIYGQQPQLVRGDVQDGHCELGEDAGKAKNVGLTHYLTNLDFHSSLAVGDTKTRYARTGYLGFVRRTNLKQSDGEYHDALFVVGSLEETMILRGMRFHPIDIEHTILRSHKKAIECAVFTWTNNLLVAVIELQGPELEALDLIPSITNAVLEHHHLITGIVVIVDPGVIPINSRGEKQRMHLRDSFLNDELDPIYVAYNM